MTTHRTHLLTLALLAAATTAALSACGTDYPLAPTAPPAAPAGSTATTTDIGAAAGAGAAAAVPVTALGPGSGTGTRSGSGSGRSATEPGGPGGSTGSDGGGHTAPAAPAPAIASFRVVSKPVCPVHGTPDAPFSTPGSGVTIAWSVTGADGAALAVDDPTLYGAYGTSFPAKGQREFAFGCEPGTTTTHTFTVWPAGATGTSKTLTVSAHSDG